MKESRLLVLPLIIVNLLCLGIPTVSLGDIIAEFNDGNTSAAVDGYEGMAGNGWAGEWTTGDITQGSAVSIGVVDDDPLSSGSGNYLSVTNGPGNRDVTVYREYGNYGGIDLSKDHTITFEFRFDDMTAWEESSATWIRITNSDDEDPNNKRQRWQISTRNHSSYRNWTFRDGDRAGGQTFVQSDMAVVEGVTYFFQIDVVPSTSSYYVTVTNSLGESYQSGEFGFRRDDTVGGTVIGFNNQKASGATEDKPSAFSIDNIRIIPEPSSLMLLSVPVGLWFFARGRR